MGVLLEIDGRQALALPGDTIFATAERVGVAVPTSCRKQGKCRECLVEIQAGMPLLASAAPEEKHLAPPFRLACRARIQAGEGVVRCHTLRRSRMAVVEDGVGLPALGGIDPAVRRDGDWVLLDGEPICRSAGPLYGLAVDLGTTTVVLRLVDLASGCVAATRSFENPQRFAGSDIMARIHFDTQDATGLLRRTLTGYLNRAIESLPCGPQDIYEAVVAGNTAMRDIFFGLDVHGVGQKPYRSKTEVEWRAGRRNTTSLREPVGKLRLAMRKEGRVYGLPLIGSHVGADAAACLLAVDWMHLREPAALMDIGTNTELIAGNRRHTLAASCPAGPAFEGWGLTCGMPAVEGAIESALFAEDGSLRTRVIGNGAAEGLCGSGLIELLGELLRTGRMNELGRLENGEDRLVVDASGSVCVSENDISQLAQAKGANMAGAYIVLRRIGLDFAGLDRLYLAGGFGRHLNLDAARRIGLIPDLPDHKIHRIGNAAIEGATVALLSSSRRTALEQFVAGIGHVELETDPDFFEHFVQGCIFAPVRSTEYIA